MKEINYRGKKFPSLAAVTRMPTLRVTARSSMKSYLNISDNSSDSPIVRVSIGNLDLISYKGAVLPPTFGSYAVAVQASDIASVMMETSPKPMVIVDVGTGSGIMAVAMADRLKNRIHRHDAILVATDISGEALEVASLNAQINQVDDMIRFRKRDILNDLVAEFGRLDLIVSNPPFYAQSQKKNKQSHFIPDIAMFAGDDQFLFYERLFSQLGEALSDQGVCIVQIQPHKLKDILARLYRHLPSAHYQELFDKFGRASAILIQKTQQDISKIGINSIR